MARFRTRWALAVVSAALLVGVGLGLLGLRRSRLAEEHARRAQRALDEMYRYNYNITWTAARSKTARPGSKRAEYEAMAKYARDKLARLEEVAARHERLAREYGYRAPLKRPESDANPGDAPKIGPDGRREETRAAGPR